ncbi:hypothetical protein ACGFOU_31700 [Streptomyces sp. NPDC048595]|uniref:hypothetical protein n=1 Tax=Streptomyces sp. NPDC048595 TaxID=3365576 RepID=UPI003720E63D
MIANRLASSLVKGREPLATEPPSATRNAATATTATAAMPMMAAVRRDRGHRRRSAGRSGGACRILALRTRFDADTVRFILSITTSSGRRGLAAALGSPVAEHAKAGPRGPAEV